MNIDNNGKFCNRSICVHNTLIVKIQVLCIFCKNNETHKMEKYRPWMELHKYKRCKFSYAVRNILVPFNWRRVYSSQI